MRQLIKETESSWRLDLTNYMVFKISVMYHVVLYGVPVFNSSSFEEVEKFCDNINFF